MIMKLLEGYTLKPHCNEIINNHKNLCWITPKGWRKPEEEICNCCVNKYNSQNTINAEVLYKVKKATV